MNEDLHGNCHHIRFENAMLPNGVYGHKNFKCEVLHPLRMPEWIITWEEKLDVYRAKKNDKIDQFMEDIYNAI